MIISHELRYVYIGIPRTASKSMSEWLVKRYSGDWFGYHHQWQVPQVATDYLRFTIVRNPYERTASMMFGKLWGEEKPDPAKRVLSRKPESSRDPLDERIREAILLGNAKIVDDKSSVPEAGMNQSQFIRRAGVTLVLYFERLPQCLGDLPFVDQDQMHPLPYAIEKGIRPEGTFFDHFTSEDEQVTWAHSSDDFKLLGYKRYDPTLPKHSPNSLWIT